LFGTQFQAAPKLLFPFPVLVVPGKIKSNINEG
jgi:hypothetical protein